MSVYSCEILWAVGLEYTDVASPLCRSQGSWKSHNDSGLQRCVPAHDMEAASPVTEPRKSHSITLLHRIGSTRVTFLPRFARQSEGRGCGHRCKFGNRISFKENTRLESSVGPEVPKATAECTTEAGGWDSKKHTQRKWGR